MKDKAFAILCTGMILICSGIRAQDFPSLTANEIRGLEILNQKTYQGDALFGYIDGGAELYLNYGFEKLHLQAVSLNGQKYTILIYQMADPKSAYGIYSLSRFKCENIIKLTRCDCSATYQYMAARDKYFFSVINETGTKEAKDAGLRLAGLVCQKIRQDSIPWPELFSMDAFINHVFALRYIKDNIGLQQGLLDWASYFETIKTFSFWYLPIENEKSGILAIALLTFPDPADAKVFILKTGATVLNADEKLPAGPGKIAWKIGEYSILYIDATNYNDSAQFYICAAGSFLQRWK